MSRITSTNVNVICASKILSMKTEVQSACVACPTWYDMTSLVLEWKYMSLPSTRILGTACSYIWAIKSPYREARYNDLTALNLPLDGYQLQKLYQRSQRSVGDVLPQIFHLVTPMNCQLPNLDCESWNCRQGLSSKVQPYITGYTYARRAQETAWCWGGLLGTLANVHRRTQCWLPFNQAVV